MKNTQILTQLLDWVVRSLIDIYIYIEHVLHWLYLSKVYHNTTIDCVNCPGPWYNLIHGGVGGEKTEEVETFIMRTMVLRAIMVMMAYSNGGDTTNFHILNWKDSLSSGMYRVRGLALMAKSIHALWGSWTTGDRRGEWEGGGGGQEGGEGGRRKGWKEGKKESIKKEPEHRTWLTLNLTGSQSTAVIKWSLLPFIFISTLENNTSESTVTATRRPRGEHVFRERSASKRANCKHTVIAGQK